MYVGNRHLGCWDQKEVPAVYLEQVLPEFGQLPCAGHALSVHQKRGKDLDVAMMGDVNIKHKVDQRSL